MILSALFILAPLVLGSVFAPGSVSPQASAPSQASPAQDTSAAAGAPAAASTLPPAPKGKSTVIGGEIRSIDAVRDQFTLKVFGGKPVKILFDERTQVYDNGKRIRVLDLQPAQHASVETLLDGTKIFALRIHTLSDLPEGETQGRVTSYNMQTGELTLNAAALKEPIVLHVPADVPVQSVGQHVAEGKPSTLSEITRGSLIDVGFKSGAKGHGVATHIDILATPGASFEFAGTLSSLDAHTGHLAIIDPQDDQTYQVVYNPAQLHISGDLHQGSRVRVDTTFDGTNYVASQITIE
jgi:hypothetical protein